MEIWIEPANTLWPRNFRTWVSQNFLPKIKKRKLRGYCYLVIGQNFRKKITYKGNTVNYEYFEGENYEVIV